MELRGKFQGFDFAHLLQMLAITAKNGRLRLEGDDSQGLVLLRNGKIICAVSTSVRESLGSILLSRGWLTREQLERGLAMQQESDEERRLGAILVDEDLLDQERLEAAVAEQTGQVISEFLRWRSGSFEFDEVRFPDHGEVELDTGRLPLEHGLAADQVLLGIADQASKELHAVPPPTVEVPSLPEVVRDFPAPLVTGEIAHKILEQAQGVVSRAVLFQVGPADLIGVSQFGVFGGEGPEEALIRDVRLTLRADSVLRRVGATRVHHQGSLEQTVGNRSLVEALGGEWPSEVFAGPLFAGGRVMMVFYGDNLPACEPLGDTSELATELLRSGSMLEHCLLSRIA